MTGLEAQLAEMRGVASVSAQQAAKHGEALASFASKSRLGAVKQVQQILARMSKGELGLRLVVWRTSMHQDHTDRQHLSTVSSLESKIERYEGEMDEMDHNMEMLRSLFSDFRDGSEQDRARLLSRHHALLSRLAKGAVKHLQQILSRMCKGELGLRVVVWKTAMQQEQMASLYGNKSTLEEQLEGARQGRQVQQSEIVSLQASLSSTQAELKAAKQEHDQGEERIAGVCMELGDGTGSHACVQGWRHSLLRCVESPLCLQCKHLLREK